VAKPAPDWEKVIAGLAEAARPAGEAMAVLQKALGDLAAEAGEQARQALKTLAARLSTAPAGEQEKSDDQ
jgi:hypothetical protein